MKWLKSYKIFESVSLSEINDFHKALREIFLELEDDNYEVSVSYSLFNDQFTVSIVNKPASEDCSGVIPSLSHSISYMTDNNFDFSLKIYWTEYLSEMGSGVETEEYSTFTSDRIEKEGLEVLNFYKDWDYIEIYFK
jgi:hypothetical protein